MRLSVWPEHLSAARRQVAAKAAQVACVSPDVLEDIKLAVGEAMPNCFFHASDGYVDIDVIPHLYEVEVSIASVGNAENAPAIADALNAAPCDPATSECGRGVHILRALAKDVRFEGDAYKLSFDACTRAIVPIAAS